MTHQVRPSYCAELRSFFLSASSRRAAGWMILFSILLVCLPALAQLDTGSLSGTVKDPSGSVVAYAQITATETATGTTYKTVSSSAGYYVFPSVRTGDYQLTIAAPGFKTTVTSGISVSIGAAAARDGHGRRGKHSRGSRVESPRPRHSASGQGALLHERNGRHILRDCTE